MVEVRYPYFMSKIGPTKTERLGSRTVFSDRRKGPELAGTRPLLSSPTDVPINSSILYVTTLPCEDYDSPKEVG